MAPLRDIARILVAGAAMQDRAVVEELDVAFADRHVEIEVGRGGNSLQRVQRLTLPLGHDGIAGGDRAARIAARDVATEFAALAGEDHDLFDQRAIAEFGVALHAAEHIAVAVTFTTTRHPSENPCGY